MGEQVTKLDDRGANIIAHEYGHRVSQGWGLPYGPGGPGDGLPQNGLDENWANYAALWSLNHWIEYYDGGSLNYSTQTYRLNGRPGWSWSMADAWLDLNLTGPKEPVEKVQQTLAASKPTTVQQFYEAYIKSKPITYSNWVKGVFSDHAYSIGTWPVTTAVGLGFPLQSDLITFTGGYADRGVDTNVDGRYESLAVDLGLTSASTGTHNVSAGLYNAGGSAIVYGSSIQTLTSGVQTVTVNFDGTAIRASGQSGPYHLNDIYVQQSSSSKPEVGQIVGQLSAAGGVYTTAAYTNSLFAAAAAAFTGTLSDGGVDTDGNGHYDYLRLSAPVEVRQSGQYQASAVLNAADGTYLSDAASAVVTGTGGSVVTLTLNFNGELINRWAKNGPYTVSSLTIYDGAWRLVSRRAGTYTTSAYTYGQFDDYPKAELLVDAARITSLPAIPGIGDGVTYFVPISNTGVVTAPEVPVQLTITGSLTTQVQTLEVPAGGGNYAIFTWTAQTGYHTFTVAVDPDNLISETNKANNVVTWTTALSGLPDFAVTGITATSYPLYSVISASVVNQGSMPVTYDLDVATYIDGSLVATRTVNLLGSHVLTGSGYMWSPEVGTAPPLSGTHVISVVADVPNAFPEPTKANNTFSQAITMTYVPLTDGFGYVATPSGIAGGPTFDWINIISTGTPITSWTNTYNDEAGPMPIGFEFPFYGAAYTGIYVSTEGYLSFASSSGVTPYDSSTYNEYRLPSTYQPRNAVFPFGCDGSVYDRGVYYQQLSSPTRFVVLYDGLQCYGSDYVYRDYTFEVVLYPNGNILMQYQTAPAYEALVIGMQNHQATYGLWLGTRAWDGLAIRISYPLPPDINLNPAAVAATLAAGQSTLTTVMVENLGLGTLEFAIGRSSSTAGAGLALVEELASQEKGKPERMTFSPVVLGSGGPDSYGYTWKDSDASGGPTYSWVELSGTGTAVGTCCDDEYGSVPIGFPFGFYGNVYTTAYASTNGLLTFGTGSNDWSNDPIPSTNSPNNFVAPFWDDLNVESASYFRYQTLGSAPNRRLVVEWNGIRSYGGSGRDLTFEVILDETTNRILVQYQTMTGTLNSASIGIEDASGTDGLQVAYNQSYVHDNLAVEFIPWLQVSPLAGTVAPGGSMPISVSLNAANLTTGTYTATLIFDTNDPDEDPVLLPVTLTVSGTVQAPSGGYVVGAIDLQGRSNDDGATVYLGGAYSTTTAAGGAFAFSYIPTGTYTVTASRDGYLYATHSAIAVSHGATATLSTVRLLGGNADFDGDIDIYDLTALGASFGTSGGPADINGDGAVNVFDLVMVGSNFGRSAPTPWP